MSNDKPAYECERVRADRLAVENVELRDALKRARRWRRDDPHVSVWDAWSRDWDLIGALLASDPDQRGADILEAADHLAAIAGRHVVMADPAWPEGMRAVNVYQDVRVLGLRPAGGESA